MAGEFIQTRCRLIQRYARCVYATSWLNRQVSWRHRSFGQRSASFATFVMPQRIYAIASATRLLPLLAFSLLAACTLSTPFHLRDPAAIQSGGEVLLVVTHIVLKQDSEARARFWEAERRVDSMMLDQPGLIGYAKRLEVFGDEAWTMSAWVDTASLDAFVRSEAHRKAMTDARDSYVDARFARAMIPGHRVPLPWSEVLAILGRSARHYYE